MNANMTHEEKQVCMMLKSKIAQFARIRESGSRDMGEVAVAFQMLLADVELDIAALRHRSFEI